MNDGGFYNQLTGYLTIVIKIDQVERWEIRLCNLIVAPSCAL